MTNTRFRRLPIAITTSTLLASALVAGLVGCSASGGSSGTTAGGSSSSAAGGSKTVGKVDPCVLTGAEAGATINKPITTAKSDAAECEYSGGGYFFSVNVFPNSTSSDWTTQLQVLNITKKSTAVSGVGDKAAGSGSVFDVQSGSYILNVIGADEDGTTTWPESVALAKAFIAKLP
jgi:hypothetical protein